MGPLLAASVVHGQQTRGDSQVSSIETCKEEVRSDQVYDEVNSANDQHPGAPACQLQQHDDRSVPPPMQDTKPLHGFRHGLQNNAGCALSLNWITAHVSHLPPLSLIYIRVRRASKHPQSSPTARFNRCRSPHLRGWRNHRVSRPVLHWAPFHIRHDPPQPHTSRCGNHLIYNHHFLYHFLLLTPLPNMYIQMTGKGHRASPIYAKLGFDSSEFETKNRHFSGIIHTDGFSLTVVMVKRYPLWQNKLRRDVAAAAVAQQ